MNKLLQVIKEQLMLLAQSKISLQNSFNESKKLTENNLHHEFSLQQQDVFEAFVSRLTRTADILVQSNEIGLLEIVKIKSSIFKNIPEQKTDLLVSKSNETNRFVEFISNQLISLI